MLTQIHKTTSHSISVSVAQSLNPYLDPDIFCLNRIRIQAVAESRSKPTFFSDKETFFLFQKPFYLSSKTSTKDTLGSRRSFQPNRELLKHEISSFFLFWNNFVLSKSGSETLLRIRYGRQVCCEKFMCYQRLCCILQLLP